MPYYADSSRYSQVAHEAQLAHYGLPTGGAPQPQMSRPGEYKGSVSQRKPVQTSTARNQEGPYPSMSSTPARKPVGGYRTVSSTSTRQQSPAPAKSNAYTGYNKPLPPTPSADSRPGSSSGWSFSRRKRTDSNASNATGASVGSRSRAGSFSSFTDAVKKTGKWVAQKAEIVAMPAKEREALFQSAKRKVEEETEQKRQRGEISRPTYQKQYLTQQIWGVETVGGTFADADYEARREHEASRQRRAAAYKRKHERDCREAAAYGLPRPLTPEMVNLTPPQLKDTISPIENDFAQATFGGSDPEAKRPKPSTIDQYAKLLSQALDPLKKRQDSDVSFSDMAPTGTMDYCSKCGHPPRKFLGHNGLCEDCIQGKYFGK
jgi:hypothetical protein